MGSSFVLMESSLPLVSPAPARFPSLLPILLASDPALDAGLYLVRFSTTLSTIPSAVSPPEWMLLRDLGKEWRECIGKTGPWI